MTYNTSIVKQCVKATYDKQYIAMQNKPYLMALEAIFMRTPSSSSSESYAWLGDVPGVVKWIGDKSLKGLKDYDYTIKNDDFYSGFAIDRNDLEDDKVKSIVPRVKMVAESVVKYPSELVISLLENGTTNLAYDGAAFFSNRTAPNDNLLAGTGTTSAQVKADITAARVAMMKFTSDQDKVMGLIGSTVVCPPEMEDTFLELTTSVTGEATSRPQATWIKNVITCPELADSNDWYLLATDAPLKPFLFQERKKATTVFDDTQTARNRKIEYSAEMRGNAGYGFFQMAIKTVNA